MKRMSAVAFCVLVSVAFTRVSAASDSVGEYIDVVESPQHPDRSGFDSLTLEQVMRRFHVPGMSVAVIKDFRIHWTKGYGIADVETGARVDTETLFQAASISKPVTSMAMLKAVQDGKFALDEDINTILRSWKLSGGAFAEGRAVTPRTLASHTSGLGDGFGFPGYGPADPLPTTVQILNGERPSNVGAVLMERPPLRVMKYSGGGFTVLQLALTDAMERPFPEILRDNVLKKGYGVVVMTNASSGGGVVNEIKERVERAYGWDSLDKPAPR